MVDSPTIDEKVRRWPEAKAEPTEEIDGQFGEDGSDFKDARNQMKIVLLEEAEA